LGVEFFLGGDVHFFILFWVFMYLILVVGFVDFEAGCGKRVGVCVGFLVVRLGGA
jgi:hypothetical protein